MIARDALCKWIALVALMAVGDSAPAAIALFHFVPVNGTGAVQLVPLGPDAPAEKISVLGREPYACPPKPTCVVPFCHPYTQVTLQVPLALPEGTPQMMHRRDRIIYNYGSYTVTVHFLPDGSVNVIYNSGLLRGI